MAILATPLTSRTPDDLRSKPGTAAYWWNESKASRQKRSICEYGEIDHFEEQLVTDGILLLKFWIHISKAEQLKRFRDRSRTSYKQWKITDEDWRNRKRWDDYTVAVNDMVARTSTKIAPWTLVEGNDKNFARIKVLRTSRIAWTIA